MATILPTSATDDDCPRQKGASLPAIGQTHRPRTDCGLDERSPRAGSRGNDVAPWDARRSDVLVDDGDRMTERAEQVSNLSLVQAPDARIHAVDPPACERNRPIARVELVEVQARAAARHRRVPIGERAPTRWGFVTAP